MRTGFGLGLGQWIALAIVAAGCGEPGSGEPARGAPDAELDAGLDASPNADTDDARPVAAAPDAGPRADALDAAIEPDANTPPDAAEAAAEPDAGAAADADVPDAHEPDPPLPDPTCEGRAGELLWARSAGGGSYDLSRAFAVAADPNGGVYTTGEWGRSITFGAGEPNQTTLVSAAQYGAFVARFGADGSLAWVKNITDAFAAGQDVAMLPDGAVLVAGNFSSVRDATFGLGQLSQTTLQGSTTSTMFLAKYAADGAFAWAVQANGAPANIALANSVSAWADGSSVVLGNSTRPTPMEHDATLVRYSPAGALVWARLLPFTNIEVVTIPDGSLVVVGYFWEEATFAPGEPEETRLTGVSENMFIARYDADGQLMYATSAGGAGGTRAFGVAALTDGTALVAGDFGASATFGAGEPNETTLTSAGSRDIFVARHAPDGRLVWARRAGGAGLDMGNGVAVHADGSVTVGGQFEQSAIFGSGEAGEVMLVSRGASDVFVAEYGNDGVLRAARSAGGVNHDTLTAMETAADASILAVGFFNTTYNGGPSPASTFRIGAGEPNETLLTSAGDDDLFIANFRACVLP